MIGGVSKPRLRKRVVTIFVIAVLIPCVFLGYLGLKSIRQERQWQQLLVLENLKRSLSLAVDRIESGLDDHIRASFRQLSPPRQLTTIHIASLRTFSTQSSLVQGVFFLDNNLRVVFPKTFRDVDIDGMKDRSALRLQESEYLRAGDLFEVQGKLGEALTEYQRGFSVKVSKPLQAAFLSRIARCQFKQTDYGNARRTYQRIINDDHNQFYGEGMPYVLVAHLQLLEIAEKNGSSSAMGNELLDFYQMLVERFDKCERAQYGFCLNQVKSRLERQQHSLSPSQRAALDSIATLEKEIGDEQRFREMLLATIVPRIRQNLDSRGKGNLRFGDLREKREIRYFSEKGDSSLWTIAVRANDDEQSFVRFVGFKIRQNALTETALPVLKQSQPSEDVRIALIDTANNILAPSELATASVVLTQAFARFEQLASGTRLALVAKGEDPLEAISSKSLLIYYVLLGSVIVLIAFGIVFILRDISREERIAVMKSEFIANVSHEIKTPIATIRTLSENLNEGWVTGQEQQREYFHLIEREAQRLTHLVENILDFSRVDRGKKTYRTEVTSIRDATEKAIERFRLLVDGQGVAIKENIKSNLPPCNLDVEAYEQALLNLLDNAVKYSRNEKVVEVSARLQNNAILVAVTDHGIGIRKKDSERIFDKFYRAPLQDGRNIPGSGIGLTLVKETIEAHAGTIEVESEVGKGSTFTLSFPLPKDKTRETTP
jgi:signal transduction histidine kinase